MSQQRLNHLAVLHVHREKLDGNDIDVVAREFVAKSPKSYGDIWTHLNCAGRALHVNNCYADLYAIQCSLQSLFIMDQGDVLHVS